MTKSEFDARLVAFRRDLHQFPELAFEENRTADRICEALDEMGVSYRQGVAKTGIVAEIPGGEAGVTPYVALRADIDALPITEETGLEFASENEGVMHACGHDGHTTMVLGAAELLAAEQRLPAPVRILFQPAEEAGAGAKAMIEEGVLDNVAMIFGGHVDPHYTTGQIVTHTGAVNASSDAFHIEVIGKSGHAARPHEGIDSIVVGSALVTTIQIIVAREIHPADPAVITVGRFRAGTAGNILAGKAVLDGTMRAQRPAVREHLAESLRRICQAVGSAYRAEVRLEIREGTPPIINSPEMAALARRAASRVVGEDNAVPLQSANMGGEDFSYYMQKIPGCYVRLGITAPDGKGFPAHSSRFDLDENVLPIGARFYHELAKSAGELLRSLP